MSVKVLFAVIYAVILLACSRLRDSGEKSLIRPHYTI